MSTSLRNWISGLAGAVVLSVTAVALADGEPCYADRDCPGTSCGDAVCNWTRENPNGVGSKLFTCNPAGTDVQGSDGWCTTNDDCKCQALGATCVNAHCSFTLADSAGAQTGSAGAGGADPGAAGAAGAAGGAGGAGGSSDGTGGPGGASDSASAPGGASDSTSGDAHATGGRVGSEAGTAGSAPISGKPGQSAGGSDASHGRESASCGCRLAATERSGAGAAWLLGLVLMRRRRALRRRAASHPLDVERALVTNLGN